MSEPQKAELVTSDGSPNGALVPAAMESLIPEGDRARVWSTFPLVTMEQRIRCLNTLNGPTRPIAEMDKQTILVRDIVASDAEWADSVTGEVITAVRIVFMLADGSAVASVGETARQALGRILRVCPPPWPDGLPIRIDRGMSNAKRPVYSLTISQPNLATGKPAGADKPKGK